VVNDDGRGKIVDVFRFDRPIFKQNYRNVLAAVVKVIFVVCSPRSVVTEHTM